MAKVWTCRECGSPNEGFRDCEGCGASRSGARGAGKPAVKLIQACGWMNQGGTRCTMTATMYPWPAAEGATGLCSWHWIVREQGRPLTFAAFLEWQMELVNGHYCNDWTHHDVEALWRWTLGEGSGMGPQHQCARESCILIWEAERETRQTTLATAEQAKAAIAAINRAISLKGIKPLAIPVAATPDVGNEEPDW